MCSRDVDIDALNTSLVATIPSCGATSSAHVGYVHFRGASSFRECRAAISSERAPHLQHLGVRDLFAGHWLHGNGHLAQG